MKYVLGLDLGIASVGWAMLQKNDEGNVEKIVDLGSRVFNKLEDKDGKLQNVDRRNKRSMRRQGRRKKLRREDLRKLLKKQFNIDFLQIDFSKYENPFELKVKGLTEKLSAEEFMIILYHYMKYRGFKSSRKVEDKKNDGKFLAKIEEVNKELGDNLTISQYLVNRYSSMPIESRRIHNTSEEYFLSVSRNMYLNEIEKIFETQINFKVIEESFKEEYLKIYNRQRDFSQGPGIGSKFGANGGSFIEKMVGKCHFDQNIRAPRESFSAEAFRLLSFLNNFSYKESMEDKNYKQLTKEEIVEIFNFAKTKKEITYKDIFKRIKKECYRIKGLELSKKQYLDVVTKYKEKKNIPSNEKVDPSLYEEISVFSKEQLLSKKINVSLSNYCTVKKTFNDYAKKNKESKNIIEEFISNEENFDTISVILLFNKTDDTVKEACLKEGFSNEIVDVVATLPNVTQTIDLSLNVCRKIIPFLKEGKKYSEAMSEAGYNHSSTTSVAKTKFLPEIDEAIKGIDEYLTNPNVRHTLVFMRQIINELIKRYGEISEYNIELSRELKRSFTQRRQMNYDMVDNQQNNAQLKIEILKKYPNIFNSLYAIKRDDLLKYKLFKEQSGYCAYSYTKIIESSLFDNNLYQIDHILPYSRTYDDSYTNKVLVTAKMNQDKGNNTPKEYFKNDLFNNILNFLKNTSIGNKKRDKLLANEIDEDFIERNIVDTSYMSKMAKKLIESYLQPEKCTCPSGSITDALKNAWRLKGATHSYINSEYKNRTTYLLENYQVSKNQIVLDFSIADSSEKRNLVIKGKDPKQAKKQTELQVIDALEFFYKNPSLIESEFLRYKNKSISLFIGDVSLNTNSENKLTYLEHLLVIANEISLWMTSDRLKKDRGNDLHHALDAAVVAASTLRDITRVTRQNLKGSAAHKFDEETGELIDDSNDLFPLPYKEFREDVLIRVYERDKQTLLNKLNNLDTYSNSLERRDVHVLYPTRLPEKYKNGAFSEETIFGTRQNLIVKRTRVNSLTVRSLENMYDINGANKPVYTACKEWLELPSSTRSKYPYHPTKHNPIKSVLLIETSDKRKRLELSTGKFAKNGLCIRVDVYKSKADNSLYMVPIYNIQLAREKKGMQVDYQIMRTQGNMEYITNKQLQIDFDKVCSLPRYSLIELEKADGSTALCYTGGASSGFFEVYSIIGDGQDLIHDELFIKIPKQWQLTISTIKSIKVRSISILGELN